MSGKFILGVDTGGTKTNLSIKTPQGELVDLRRYEYEQSDHALVVQEILGIIDSYLSSHPLKDRIAAIGMGLKGHVLSREGIWNRCISIPNFKPVALGNIICEKYSLPTFLDNDVHAATLAEKHYGIGQKYEDFIYYNIGTGLSIGIVADGRLLRGSTNYSGEIGHMVTESDGESCPCGHFGCLEEVSSGAAIIKMAKQGMEKHPESLLASLEGRLHSSAVFAAARKGDALAMEVSQRALKSICLSMVAIINIFNPSAIVFGGGVMSDTYLLPAIREYAWKYPLRPAAEALKEVCISRIGSDIVGTLGACCVAEEGLDRF